MKKSTIFLLATSFLPISFGSSVFAEGLSSGIAALEQKAQIVEIEITKARHLSAGALDQQIKPLMSQIEDLIKQRATLDSQISEIAGSIRTLRRLREPVSDNSDQ